MELKDASYARSFLRAKVVVNTFNLLVAGCWLSRGKIWIHGWSFDMKDYKTFATNVGKLVM